MQTKRTLIIADYEPDLARLGNEFSIQGYENTLHMIVSSRSFTRCGFKNLVIKPDLYHAAILTPHQRGLQELQGISKQIRILLDLQIPVIFHWTLSTRAPNTWPIVQMVEQSHASLVSKGLYYVNRADLVPETIKILNRDNNEQTT